MALRGGKAEEETSQEPAALTRVLTAPGPLAPDHFPVPYPWLRTPPLTI